MQQYKLSICIPARNELFLARTVQDILEHKEDDTEIIVALDGKWADPVIPQHPDVNIIYLPESVGQREATGLCVALSKAKYIIKCDAHCSFDQGFDRKMLEFFKEVGDDVVAAPIMKNLHAFSWKCYHCGWKKYQGPTPIECGQCKKGDKIRRKMVWEPRRGINSTSYCFDPEPHFQYFEDWKHREPYITDKREKGYTETMSLQGSFFMCTREKYLELLDDSVGSWGNQGMQVACSFWLSGNRVLINHKTWTAHMFRTQGGDFGFPYEQKGNDVKRTKDKVRDLFWDFKHPKQIRPVSWLVEKFWPIKGSWGEWKEEDLNKIKQEMV
jgi:glycosyltransferase involved in cell wall biosynthesis